MAMKTYHGSCHCKRVTFEADLDLEKGTGKCNCTFCWKTRNWSVIGKPEQLRLLTGKDDLTDYSKSDFAHFLFCKHCGVRTHGHGVNPHIGGAFVSVVLSTLDDLPPGELVEAPVRHFDGLANNWMNTPAEVRHL
jgi:hypothetical protein